jgi:hypothetical protein
MDSFIDIQVGTMYVHTENEYLDHICDRKILDKYAEIEN